MDDHPPESLLPSAGSAAGLLGGESNPMLMVALGIGGVLLLVVLLVAVSGGGQRRTLGRADGRGDRGSDGDGAVDRPDGVPVPVGPLPYYVRSARRAMYFTGGFVLLGVVGSAIQPATELSAAGIGVATAYGIALLAAGSRLKIPSRGVFVFAVALQLLILCPFLGLSVWFVAGGFPLGLVITVIPLLLSANALHLLYRCRDFYPARV